MFEDIMVDGIGLIGLNVAIVQRAKMFGVSGKALLALSTGLGFVTGFVYKIQKGIPTTTEEWIATAIFSIAMAVIPSGLVDVARDTGRHIVKNTSKAVRRTMGVM